MLEAAAAAMVGLAGSGLELRVYDVESGTVVYARSVEIGESFQLEHTHSVTERPVVETFAVGDDTELLLREMWFDDFGPNLPAGPEQLDGHPVTFRHDDGAYRVRHHDAPIGTLPLRVGSPEVDHTVVFSDGRRLRLLDVARRGAYVELAVSGS